MTSPTTAPGRAPIDCPFVGLQPFSPAHAPFFFGRDHDALVIVDNLMSRPVSVLYGASGTGKSSVLNAGLAKVFEDAGEDVRLVVRQAWHEPDNLVGWLAEVARAAAETPERSLILVFDQFEEYFLYRRPEAGEAFERATAELLARTDIEAHLLLALRADALHTLDALRLRLPAVMDNTIELQHLDERGVRAAIEGPIRIYNAGAGAAERMSLEPDFTSGLIEGLRGSLGAASQQRPGRGAYVELPFLQLALQRLWRGARDEADGSPATLSLRLLADQGGVDGVVGAHVREKLDGGLDKTEKRLASQIFHYLVTPSGGKFAHLPHDLAELASESADQPIDAEAVARLLDKLAEGDARILRKTGDRFELFHDVLAQPILNWRADYRKAAYLDEEPFARVVDPFSGAGTEMLGAGVLVGRAPRELEGQTLLAEPMVSRTHLLVMRDGLVLDLRSRYGTTVNAQPLHFGETGVALKDGDVLGLGNSAVLVYRIWTGAETEEVDPTLQSAWGVLIDGGRRRVVALPDPPVELGLVDGAIVAGRKGEVAGPFARITGDGGAFWLGALTETPVLNVIEREDSRFDRVWALEPGNPFKVDLDDIPPDKPTTMADFEGAHRALFEYAGARFEIILNRI